MHHCLFISEIVSLIGENLEPSTLAKVSRTCRALTDPALNVLWRSQNSLGPLIQVMPSDLWAVVASEEHRFDDFVKTVNIVNFLRGLEETDWTRFEYYGRKIRRLKNDFENPTDIFIAHEDVLMALSAYRPVRTLLPSLREISLDLKQENIFRSMPFFQCLLGPTVQHVGIHFDGLADAAALPSLLSSIVRMCPDISSFEVIRDDDFSNGRRPVPYHSLCIQRNLRHVDINDSMPAEVILHLGQLPSLRTWRSVVVTSGPELRWFTTHGERFLNLRHFSFTAVGWNTAAEIIHSMRCPFETLSVHVVDDTPREHWDTHSAFGRFLRSFDRHPALLLLKDLEIEGNVVISENDHETRKSLSDTLEKLLRSLTSVLLRLVLDVQAMNCLLDNIFLLSTDLWPRLRVLRLVGRGTPRVTLGGLVFVLDSCPDLVVLDVSALWRPFLTNRVTHCSRNSRITTMRMCDSEIENPVGVFRCLSLMFPRLRQVWNIRFQAENGEGWRQLRQMLQESALCAAWEP
ncbi:hypothetical protein Hypma_010806 [Hypsizygus marmoreus]|uniref:F-box domain-containing protein n=1 Tax=Hypsizygus marmoreus TaxID=39966 RepID=A0A369JI32_HYPMA|nr:hypothetical protein Hypma_010806 [Hypsizygus marmoreus]